VVEPVPSSRHNRPDLNIYFDQMVLTGSQVKQVFFINLGLQPYHEPVAEWYPSRVRDGPPRLTRTS
jgi:hypothetical protein